MKKILFLLSIIAPIALVFCVIVYFTERGIDNDVRRVMQHRAQKHQVIRL